ncbi:hypothetical protein, partial [Mucilaginibacter sp.]|uniref:hypothetical protein n=1 Tax=Mucilaginibacter sp. TaxID=1882438 RepID=UPI002ED5562F
MHTALTPASQTNHIQLRYPEGFTAASCLEERKLEIRFTDGSIKIDECWFDGICVVYNVFDSALPFTLTFNYPAPCRALFFTLEGQIVIDQETTLLKVNKGNCYSAYAQSLNANILFNNNSTL